MGGIVVMFSLVAAHTWLDLETVARLSRGASEVSDAVCPETVSGLVNLSTCNRVELYAEAGSKNVEQAADEILQSIADATGISYDEVASAFRLYCNVDAVCNLLVLGF